jgi:hypothetical protein
VKVIITDRISRHAGMKKRRKSGRKEGMEAGKQHQEQLSYFETSRPSLADISAAEVPSIGSHRRDMGGRIWFPRYHS